MVVYPGVCESTLCRVWRGIGNSKEEGRREGGGRGEGKQERRWMIDSTTGALEHRPSGARGSIRFWEQEEWRERSPCRVGDSKN